MIESYILNQILFSTSFYVFSFCLSRTGVI